MREVSEECRKELVEVMEYNILHHKGATINPLGLFGLDSQRESQHAQRVADYYDMDPGSSILEWLQRALERGVHPITVYTLFFTMAEEAEARSE